jgi:hypothetical protein
MLGKLIPKLIFTGALLASGAVWAAGPTVDQVYQAAKAGNYTEAQNLMDQVLREHPNSAKAHFIEAELLARQGKLSAARSELETAQKLDPSMSFAKPGAVEELKSMVASRGSNAMPVQMNNSNGSRVHVPWGPLLGILAIFVVVMMFLRARSRRMYGPGSAGGFRPAPGQPPMMPPGGPGAPAGYGPAGGPGMAPPAAGGMGSGILGNLATGAAVGAGIVAGEALAHKVFGDSAGHAAQAAPVNPPPANSPLTDPTTFVQNNNNGYDMGGNDFGVNDASSWDDSSSDWGDSGDSGNSDDWS